jgi:hypothetical protein
MAKTATKTVKKVSTAKGKGKPAKAKVVKKVALAKTKGDLKKPLKKAVAKKPAVKRAPKMVDPNKYGKFVIEDCPNDKYPTMVTITTAPAAYSSLIGKKYVSRERFIAFIEGEKAYVSIDKGAKSVAKELDSIGLLPMEPADIDGGK